MPHVRASLIRPLLALSATASLLCAGSSHATPAAITGLPAGGPAVLHQPLAQAPELENTGVWKAAPILVSGASAYRDGEFLYQDFLYDDLGDGSSAYPAGKAYAGNAADLVEIRVKPLATATAVRITYNTLVDPNAVATTLAFGTSATAHAWPSGARTSSPAQLFVTVHGTTASLVSAATGRTIASNAPVAVDLRRHQVEVRVPFSAFDPRGKRSVRLAAGAGVWSTKTHSYLAPDDGAALYNLAFRYNENTPPRGVPVATWWRDVNQKAALSGTTNPFAATIDFTKLSRKVNDDMPDRPGGVPVTGSMDRISVTHFSDGQGRGNKDSSSTPCNPPSCQLELRGVLQPYFVHIPTTPPGPHGYGLAVYLHGCGNNHNEMYGTSYAKQLSERDSGSIVLAPTGRGGCFWYLGASGANLFENWADLASHYPLDPTETALTGYSMGGFGTLMMSSLYPELWGRALAMHPCHRTSIGPATSVDPSALLPILPGTHDVPTALWASADDPVCEYAFQRQIRDALNADDNSFAFFTLTNDHFTDITNDVFTPAITWLGSSHVPVAPPQIRFVAAPYFSAPRYGLVPDRAYWLSDIVVRKAGTNGTLDATSQGLGRTRQPALPLQAQAGVLTGGELVPALPFVEESRAPAADTASPRADRVEVTLTNVRSLTIDTALAGLTCAAKLVVTTDGPVSIRLAGCPGAPQRFST